MVTRYNSMTSICLKSCDWVQCITGPGLVMCWTLFMDHPVGQVQSTVSRIYVLSTGVGPSFTLN